MTETTTRALDAVALARRLEDGSLTAETLVRDLLARIEAREGEVRAWAHLDPDAALAEARALDVTPRKGAFHGMPVGLKDVIDTKGMPTCYNSPIYADHVPQVDAAPTAAIRMAGGLVLGKQVTAEFAHRAPGPTRNPLDPTRTPGGSSSGSAAAVADGMVPLAVGTQTTGSTIRPAAFCGVVGYRPSFGIMGCVGVKPSAPSFDTPGLFAADVASCALLRDVLLERAPRLPSADPGRRLRLGFCRTTAWERVDRPVARAIEDAAARLARVADVVDVDLPVPMEALHRAQRTVSSYEIVRALTAERRETFDLISEDLREGRIADGVRIELEDYVAAVEALEEARAVARPWLAAVDCVVAPTATGIAPKGIASTGSSEFCLPWTALHVPAMSVPLPERVEGMPVAIQLVASRGADLALFQVAAFVEARL